MRLAAVLALALLLAGCAAQEPGPPTGEGVGDDPMPGGDGAGDEAPAPGDGEHDAEEDGNDTDHGEEPPMQIRSPAFASGDPIPSEHTADGQDTSPPLAVADVPAEAAFLAVIVDDPDAPREEPWVHWLVWNVPAEADTIAEGYPPSGDGKAFDGARQGTNSFGNERYNGPAPPEGDGPHRYRFQLFALDRQLDVEEGAQRAELEAAMEGAVIEQATLAGTYER